MEHVLDALGYLILHAPSTAWNDGRLATTSELSFVQWSAILGSIAVLVWSVPGIIINPDFATGDAATSEVILGVDMNGWHALSGFLVAVPGLFAATRRDLAGIFCLVAGLALFATGIWALLDEQAAFGLFYFPNGTADGLLHFGTSAIFLVGAYDFFIRSRTT